MQCSVFRLIGKLFWENRGLQENDRKMFPKNKREQKKVTEKSRKKLQK